MPDSAPRPGPTGRPLPQYPIESVDRTLQLLELLGRHEEVKLSAVRDELGIGQSTAHRLMAMLVYRGFAEQNPRTRAYRAGPTLFQLGRAALGEHDIIEHARPALVWLGAQSGETSHVAVLAGTDVRYLDAVETEAVLRVSIRIGQLIPAHASSIGKAMLATLTDDELLRRYPDPTLPAATDRTITDRDDLFAELRRIRARGWARNRGEAQPGVCSVAVAAIHPTHGLIGALSIATPAARSNPATEREHAALLRVAVARLTVMVP